MENYLREQLQISGERNEKIQSVCGNPRVIHPMHWCKRPGERKEQEFWASPPECLLYTALIAVTAP